MSLMALHGNPSMPFCLFLLVIQLSGAVLRLRKMGAVLIFEWAFCWTCIFDDMTILHRYFNGGVGMGAFPLFKREAATSHDKTVHLGSLEFVQRQKRSFSTFRTNHPTGLRQSHSGVSLYPVGGVLMRFFGLYGNKTRADRAAGKDTMVFTCYCDASLTQSWAMVGQTDTAELVHLLFWVVYSCLTSCMMGGALPHNLPAYFCRAFSSPLLSPGFLIRLHTRGVWNPGLMSKEGY